MRTLDIAFLSRICPQKNLLGAIRCLKQINGEAMLSIYGPVEDSDYWDKCLNEMSHLPNTIRCEYKGVVDTESVQIELRKHDIFLLPTLGENYGHVIFEALSVGCIPVISDQTPWNIIKDRKSGYICPLTYGMEHFSTALNELSQMDEDDFIHISENAVNLAREKVEQAKRDTGYRRIFG